LRIVGTARGIAGDRRGGEEQTETARVGQFKLTTVRISIIVSLPLFVSSSAMRVQSLSMQAELRFLVG
jgi:hypothetical protein